MVCGLSYNRTAGGADARLCLSAPQNGAKDGKTYGRDVATSGDLHSACERGRDARTGEETLINQPTKRPRCISRRGLFLCFTNYVSMGKIN